MSLNILIVEDEDKLARLLADYCRHEGWQTSIAGNLSDARVQFNSAAIDLVLLDVMLPDGSGLDFCREIRAQGPVPVIITSARVDELDRLLGLELGADDYVCKPFSPREVMARVKALVRRQQLDRASTEVPSDTSLHLDGTQLTCHWQGKSLLLTQVEFALLALLARHPGHIQSRQQIMTHIYDDHRVVSDRTVDSHVKKLRQKLAQTYPGWRFIESIYGAGYRLDIQQEGGDVPADDQADMSF